MTDSKHPTGHQADKYPPPPPGPPPGPPQGHNGLDMHPNEQSIPESYSELYESTPHNTGNQQQYPPYQTQPPYQQAAHQSPLPDSYGASKKANWAQRFSSLGTKAAGPLNMLANKLGAETFLPSTMDKECDKAARILRSFCKDGIYTDAQAPEIVEAPTTDADGRPIIAPAKPRKNRTLLTIPSTVINKAVGLAIFTTARAGFHLSGATGSGIIVARLPDGSWSPPSGIQVHSVGAGLVIGIDIYDCVVVINTREALEAFTKTRMSLGSDLAVVAGPWGAGGSVDFAAPQGKGKARGGGGGAPAGEGREANHEAEGKAAEATSSVPDDKVYDSPATNSNNYDINNDLKTESNPDPTRKQGDYTSWSGGDGGGGTNSSNSNSNNNPPSRPNTTERKPSALKQAMRQPTYSYVKSRGFYAGVQIDGTIITERKDANAAFYGDFISVQRILKGEVPLVPGNDRWAELVRPLFETIKGAEGWHAHSSSFGGGGGGPWANQMGPDPNSTYGATYGSVYDSKIAEENPPPKPPRSMYQGVNQGVASMNLSHDYNHNDTNYGGGSFPAKGGGSSMEATPGARAKAAEAAAETEMNSRREETERRELAGVADPRASMATAPPGYSAMAGAGERSHPAADEDMPPAYDGGGAAADAAAAARPGVSDTKGPAGPGGQA